LKKVLLLIGPTGTGKTSASLFLARRLNTEIISADSMQIYRYMDIGTAKPTPEELTGVRHHMIDIVDPWESFSAGRYIEEVKPIIDGLHHRNVLPLVTGGTGLYVKAMTRGIFEGPDADWDLREELMEQETQDPGNLYRQLSATDPAAAARIEPNDLRRIIRALEVGLKGDSVMSRMQAELTEKLTFDFVKIGLTRERSELYAIIDRRVDQMMEQGLLNEVKRVIAAIRLHNTGPLAGITALQAIGYKELVQHLEGAMTLVDAVELIKRRSRNYAKRQFTWFRKEEGIHWIDITGICDAEAIGNKVAGLTDRLCSIDDQT
jgi:tRNA dimethylallyltransferase